MKTSDKRYLRARDRYLSKLGKETKMPYREGDPTVEFEGRIETTTAKAYLIEPTMGTKKEVWLPKSQTVGMTDPNDDGNRVFTVTKWWFDRAEMNE